MKFLLSSLLVSSLLDLLFPPRCPACGGLAGGAVDKVAFCAKCAADVTPAANVGSRDCYKIGGGVFAAFEYSGAAREAVLNMKFHRRKDAAGPLASSLFRVLPKEVVKETDVVAYIPISKNRLEERGYNQTEILARKLAARIGKPAIGALARVKDTPPFYKLTPEERAAAIEGAFVSAEPNGKGVNGKTVLLIDDIITTGATVSAAVKALSEAGAARVYCAAVCVSAAENSR